MGEIADMILDGILDFQTGEYIGEPCGYPRTLEPCEETKPKKVRCKKCNRLIHPKGLSQHNKAKHQ